MALQTVFPAFSASCDQRAIPSFSNPHGPSLVPHKEETSLTGIYRSVIVSPFKSDYDTVLSRMNVSYFMVRFHTGYYVNFLLKQGRPEETAITDFFGGVANTTLTYHRFLT